MINATLPNMLPHSAGVVERRFSEWVASSYNSSNGVFAPAYPIEYKDALEGPTWLTFTANGNRTPTGTSNYFADDFTAASSGGPSATGARFHRIHYNSQ